MAGASRSGNATLNPLLVRILEARGVEPADLGRFLTPDFHNLDPPESLPGIVDAADVILAAVTEAKEIAVFGDYDCDGICATAIVVRTLRALKASVVPFLPRRLDEGYGMSEKSVARLMAEHPGVRLVVTVDNGINADGPIDWLKARGVEVVVTDHHLPGDTLPAAAVTVDPKLRAPERLSNLCGAAIAYLLAQRLVGEAKRRGIGEPTGIGGQLLVLAGLATVTDLMPLVGPNRILVAEALNRFRSWAPVGLSELHCRAARCAADRLSSRDFGFTLGPRINASGRMETAADGRNIAALDLMLSDDREEVRELARVVDDLNRQRKEVEQAMSDEAMRKVVPGAPAQLIDLPDGHPGVAGIVAARVLEKLSPPVPVCVLAGGHGSARAPEGFNLRDAFIACQDVLSRFGGHAAAGGFSVKEGQTDAFRERLCAYSAPFVGRQRHAGQLVDAWIEPEEITLDLAEDIRRLEPFGEGNPEPVFGLRGVAISQIRTFGENGRHMSIIFGSDVPRAVWWGQGERAESLRCHLSSSHDILFTIGVSDYQNRHTELRIADIIERNS